MKRKRRSTRSQYQRRRAARRKAISFCPIPAAGRGYLRTAGYYGRFAGAGGEAKFLDTDLDAVFDIVTATMESANLNIIPQGNTESERIGRKVVLTRVDIKGVLTLPTTATATKTSDIVRLLLVCDKQTNGGTFTGTNLWETDSFSSFNNLANSTRFKILKSKIFIFNASAGSGRGSTDTLSYGDVVKPFKFNVKLNLPIEFDNSATSGVVTTQRSNSLWLVSQSVDANVTMTLATSRVRFIDG